MDEDLIGEYDAYVSLTIRDGNFSVVAQGSEEDQWNGVASVELFYSGTTPDTTYTAKGFHKPIADLWDYDYAWPYYTYYYDDYNFTSFENQGIYAPWYYYFLSPGFQEIHRRTAPISVGSTYDYDYVETPAGGSVVFLTAKIYQGDQGSFADEAGISTAHLVATESQCNPSSNFTLTVNYSPPNQTREISSVLAKGFGNSSVSNWYLDAATINNNYNLSASPPTGTVSMTVNNKNGGRTRSPYDAIQVTVKGAYNSGEPFSALAKVKIQCP